MPVPLFIVDAFTDRAFAGNPAAVFLADHPLPSATMQQFAQELNLAESAFVNPEGDEYRLRWFTPSREVDLCGHATLATAHILWERGCAEHSDAIRFCTRSGLLIAVRHLDGILMDFPSLPPRPATLPPGLMEALGCRGRHVGCCGAYHLVEVESEEVLKGVRPDLRLLVQVNILGVILTSEPTTPGVDFVSRFFAPAAGIDEDSVTGSAHCCLGPFWGARLHKTELVGFQASRRGGYVQVSLRGERVLLGGQCVTVIRGETAF